MRFPHKTVHIILLLLIVRMSYVAGKLLEHLGEVEDSLDDYRNAFGIDRYRIINNDTGNWT